jgi:hypothetical protein
MTELQQLRQENTEIRQIVQEFLDKQGHHRCWWFPELFKRLATTLDLKPTVEPELPKRREFELGCWQYQDEEYGPAKPALGLWITAALLLLVLDLVSVAVPLGSVMLFLIVVFRPRWFKIIVHDVYRGKKR